MTPPESPAPSSTTSGRDGRPSPPPDTIESPRKNSATANTQAFIYPIRSAVAVKPALNRQNSNGSAGSSKYGGSTAGPSSHAGGSQKGISTPLQRPIPSRTMTKSSRGGLRRPSSPESGKDKESSQPAEEATELSAQSDSDMMVPLNGEDTQDVQPLDEEEKDRLESMTQTRFKHVATEEGHMVLTGRDGVLMRCEDEVSALPDQDPGTGISDHVHRVISSSSSGSRFTFPELCRISDAWSWCARQKTAPLLFAKLPK